MEQTNFQALIPALKKVRIFKIEGQAPYQGLNMVNATSYFLNQHLYSRLIL